jgi:hypothetical protein
MRVWSRRGFALLGALLTVVVAAAVAIPVALTVSAPKAQGSEPSASAVPVLAFYYSWFDANSWRRAKIDYPLLGRYSSDDQAVMRQHIEWAKSAGINGFIVSWKDTPTNDRRLSLLIEVARAEHFQLAMIYQGLDFNRHPLPVSQVAADFGYFQREYSHDSVWFRLDGKPLTVWSGTWAYSPADVARVVAPVRSSLLVLNTEKNLAGYQRLAEITDGDAYYWSSVNPLTNQNYAAKLDALSRAVHAGGKYWMAPFAPGFDARKVGGTKTVDRQDGSTLRAEYATAVSSSPDVLGLISWNEFSENSYVEPSQRYGHVYLDVLKDLRSAATPVPTAAADSSEPPISKAAGPSADTPASSGPFHWPFSRPLMVLLGLLIAFGLALAALRPLVRKHDEQLGLLTEPTREMPVLPASREHDS